LVVFDDTTVSNGQPSVPFDPKLWYYMAYSNDMSYVLLYGFPEDIIDPFFSKQASCLNLSIESISTKRARYFSSGDGDVTEIILATYISQELDQNERAIDILWDLDKLSNSPALPKSTWKSMGGYSVCKACGKVALSGVRKVEFDTQHCEFLVLRGKPAGSLVLVFCKF